VNAYAKRDMGKPVRDTGVGLLPPKLAQILLNFGSWLVHGQFDGESHEESPHGVRSLLRHRRDPHGVPAARLERSRLGFLPARGERLREKSRLDAQGARDSEEGRLEQSLEAGRDESHSTSRRSPT
jgi:hypothetical protein